jgi:pyruvate kinase
MQRQTKIVCTIGPATSFETDLQALIEAGMNVARLNFAHGDHAQHGAVLARIRALAERLDVPVAVLQDLAGPKVRIGTVAGGSITLEAGHPLVLTTDQVEGSTSRVSVSYANLPREVEAGHSLLLADGTIQLRVERVTGVAPVEVRDRFRHVIPDRAGPAGIEHNSIDAILLSHLHGDHCGGVPFLLMDAMLAPSGSDH